MAIKLYSKDEVYTQLDVEEKELASHPDPTKFCLLMRNLWCLVRTLAGREPAERYAAHNRGQMAECQRQLVPKSFINILNVNARCVV